MKKKKSNTKHSSNKFWLIWFCLSIFVQSFSSGILLFYFCFNINGIFSWLNKKKHWHYKLIIGKKNLSSILNSIIFCWLLSFEKQHDGKLSFFFSLSLYTLKGIFHISFWFHLLNAIMQNILQYEYSSQSEKKRFFSSSFW